MPTTVTLWTLRPDGSVAEVPPGKLDLEQQIEDAIEKAPDILGKDVLIVGRQVSTPSGPLDLLALDEETRLVVIENKRDRTPREVTSQVLDYASWANMLTLGDVEEIYADYAADPSEDEEADLSAAYRERFESDLESLVGPPRMIVVASRLDESTERMIEFLADEFDVPIDAMLFQPFNIDEPVSGTILGKTQLRPEEPSSGRRRPRRSRDHHEFWKCWIPSARSELPELSLDYIGTSTYIARRLESGIPVSMLVWTGTSSAYSQVRFDDRTNRELNTTMFEKMMERRASIEALYGSELEWENNPGSRSAYVSTLRVKIGSLVDPSEDGLRELTEVTRRLLDAVSPHVKDVYYEAINVLSSTQTGEGDQ